MTSEFDDIREEDMEVIPPDADDRAEQPAASGQSIEELSRQLEQKTGFPNHIKSFGKIQEYS